MRTQKFGDGLTFGVQLNPHNGRDVVEGRFSVRPLTRNERATAPDCVLAREVDDPVSGEHVEVQIGEGNGLRVYVLV